MGPLDALGFSVAFLNPKPWISFSETKAPHGVSMLFYVVKFGTISEDRAVRVRVGAFPSANM